GVRFETNNEYKYLTNIEAKNREKLIEQIQVKGFNQVIEEVAYTWFNRINNLTKENIEISKNDWDYFETSWDFKVHPLIKFKSNNLENSFEIWSNFAENQFNKLKSNEEELNKIFIDIYDLSDELSYEVSDKDVTIRKADRERDIKSFI